MLAWSALAALIVAVLVIGPLGNSVPAWTHQGAWLAGVCAVFTLICHLESISGR
jgi:hypothetical protein